MASADGTATTTLKLTPSREAWQTPQMTPDHGAPA